MALWVNETCLRCDKEYGTTQQALRNSVFNKDKYRICGECQKAAGLAKRDEAKQGAWKAALQVAGGFTHIAGDLRDAAVVKIIIRRICGDSLAAEAKFWNDVKKEIES